MAHDARGSFAQLDYALLHDSVERLHALPLSYHAEQSVGAMVLGSIGAVMSFAMEEREKRRFLRGIREANRRRALPTPQIEWDHRGQAVPTAKARA